MNTQPMEREKWENLKKRSLQFAISQQEMESLIEECELLRCGYQKAHFNDDGHLIVNGVWVIYG